MTLGKVTFDNSLKYIPQSEQTRKKESNIKPNTIKNNPLPRKEKKCQKSKKTHFKNNRLGFKIFK